MSMLTVRFRAARRRRAIVASLVSVFVAILGLAGAAGPTSAYWTSGGSLSALAETARLAPPTDVSVPSTAALNVAVSWQPASTGVEPEGYIIVRRTASGAETAACASGPTSLVAGPACLDADVPEGSYTYVVTAIYRSWTATGAASNAVTVAHADVLAFAVQPSDSVAGAVIDPPISVALRRPNGDPSPRAGVAITIALDDNISGGALSGTATAYTDSAGTATFGDLSIDLAGTGYTLSAVSDALAPAVSAAFSVLAMTRLGAAEGFSVLAATAIVNTGATTVSGDVGLSPGTSITGLPVSAVGGDIHLADSAAASAQSALAAAYADLSGLDAGAGAEIVGDLGGRTLLRGTFHSTAALAITGVLTLDAQGDPDAVFVFQTDAAFDTAAGSRVVLINGAQAANVFWVAAGAAGTGANSFLSGTILAVGAITLGASTELHGRALSRAAVTLSANTIRFTAALPPSVTIDGGASAVTLDAAPTISGTSSAPQFSPVTVTIAGQTLRTVVGADGSWQVGAAAIAAGPHAIIAKVRDASGNGASATQLLTIELNPASIVLGDAATYSVLAATAVVSTGATTVDGDVGVSPGTSVTGLPPEAVGGTTYAGGPQADAAQASLRAAYEDGSARVPHTEILADAGGRTFHIGVHHSTAALAITGVLTLDAQGDPDAVFVFQTDAAFDTAAGSRVVLINGAQAANVFWVVAGAAGTGANSYLSGTILALGAITLGASTELHGRALSRDAVTLSANTIIEAIAS